MFSRELHRSENERKVNFRTDKVSVGSKLLFGWPKTISFFSTYELFQKKIAWAISLNKTYYLSEKIDGHNVCISSRNWLANRTRVLCKRKDVENEKIEGISLAKFKQVFENFDRLVENLRKTELGGFSEMLLFGELVLRGTSRSKRDVYNYREKNYKPGDFLVFGFGFQYDKSEMRFDNADVSRVLNNSYERCNSPEDKMWIVSMANVDNKIFLEEVNLRTVSFLKSDSLENILTNPEYLFDLKEKRTEGFVLHNEYSRFKFKCIDYFRDSNVRNSKYIFHWNKTEWERNGDKYDDRAKKILVCLFQLVKHDINFLHHLDQTKWREFLQDCKDDWDMFDFEKITNPQVECEKIVLRNFRQFQSVNKKRLSKQIEMECKFELKNRLFQSYQRDKKNDLHDLGLGLLWCSV